MLLPPLVVATRAPCQLCIVGRALAAWLGLTRGWIRTVVMLPRVAMLLPPLAQLGVLRGSGHRPLRVAVLLPPLGGLFVGWIRRALSREGVLLPLLGGWPALELNLRNCQATGGHPGLRTRMQAILLELM